MKDKMYIEKAKTKRPEPKRRLFPTLEEFKTGIAKAVDRRNDKLVYAQLEKDDAALLLSEEDL